MKNPVNLHLETAQLIMAQREQLIKNSVDRQYAARPADWDRFKDAGYEKSLRDSEFHFTYLAEAIQHDNFPIFHDYINWLKIFFKSNNFPEHTLSETLKSMRLALLDILPQEPATLAAAFLDRAVQRIPEMYDLPPTYLEPDMPLYELAAAYLDVLLKGDRRSASQMILEAARNGTDVREIYLQVFQNTQREVGRLWHLNKITVAQEHFATAATQMVISQLYPYIFASERIDRTLVATCVDDELHDMGMRMVADFFEMEGWDTYFLGANTPEDTILATLHERRADVLAVSATLAGHVSKVTSLIARVRAAGIQPLKIMVGGYPFNLSSDLWQAVGADGYAPNAQEAVPAANRLLGVQA